MITLTDETTTAVTVSLPSPLRAENPVAEIVGWTCWFDWEAAAVENKARHPIWNVRSHTACHSEKGAARKSAL